ncbi:MAG: hypothetical protein J6C95_02935 [Muribaculaceae bacterium]|nr:hypothetical protein [Muribaculaceae bacterium]
MKKIFTTLAASVLCVCTVFALPKAFYVVKGDKITKFNFGVAENLSFSNNGHTLSVVGYDETINLDEIDYISFTAPLSTSLTSEEQKERLVQIGTEAYNGFDVKDQTEIILMCHDFIDSDTEYLAPIEFECPLDYIGVHGEFAGMMNDLKAIAAGNPAAVRSFKSKTVNFYKLEDYNGIYTANPKSGKWEKSDCPDHVELRFTGRNNVTYVTSMTYSSDFTTWTTRDFEGRFPRLVTVTFSRDSKKIATVTLNTTLNDRKSIDMKVEVDANNYYVVNTMNVVDDCIRDDVRVVVKGKDYLTASSKLSGKNFVSYEEIYDAIDESTEKWGGEYGNDLISEGNPERLIAMFKRCEATADLLGKLQVRGMGYNASKFYNEFKTDADAYYEYKKNGITYYTNGKVFKKEGSSVHVTTYDLDILGAQVNTLNSYTDAGFYYDGDSKLQGYLGWEYMEEPDEYYPYYDDKTRAYMVMDGYLLDVNRQIDYRYNEATGMDEPIYGPWQIYGYRYDENGEYLGNETINVDEKDLIYPEIVYTHYYNITPMLLFPDNTSFYMEDFFDSTSFTKLIDDYNEIIDTYLNITGQERGSDEY